MSVDMVRVLLGVFHAERRGKFPCAAVRERSIELPTGPISTAVLAWPL